MSMILEMIRLLVMEDDDEDDDGDDDDEFAQEENRPISSHTRWTPTAPSALARGTAATED